MCGSEIKGPLCTKHLGICIISKAFGQMIKVHTCKTRIKSTRERSHSINISKFDEELEEYIG